MKSKSLVLVTLFVVSGLLFFTSPAYGITTCPTDGNSGSGDNDGTANGTITVSSNQTWTANAGNAGLFNCGNVNILVTNSATLTIESYNDGDATYTEGDDYGLEIRTSGTESIPGNFTVDSGAIVSADQKGYGATVGTGGGNSNTNFWGNNGGAYGGYGGKGTDTSRNSTTNGDAFTPWSLGSGGGSGGGSTGGTGGGAIKINLTGSAATLSLSGTIKSTGGPGTDNCCADGRGSGGGSGGSIYIIAASMTGSGTITAAGGATPNMNGQNYDGGGGGGGRIALWIQDFSGFLSNIGNITAAGGVASGANNVESGQAGSVVIIDPNTSDGGVDDDVIFGSSFHFKDNLSEDDNDTFTFKNVTFQGTSSTDTTITAEDSNVFQVTATGNVAVNYTTATSASVIYVVNVTATGNCVFDANSDWKINGAWDCADFTLPSGSTMNLDGLGYGQNAGTAPGDTAGGASYGNGGAAHGGAGGDGSDSAAQNTTYGSSTAPVDFGSGGGGANETTGGSGGGKIKIISSGTMTIGGTISAKGTAGSVRAGGCHDGRGGGGGSGGSIWLQANGTITGAGALTVKGGAGGNSSCYDGGGGGGGRIRIQYSTNNFTGTTDVTGGAGGDNSASAGGSGSSSSAANSAPNAPTVSQVGSESSFPATNIGRQPAITSSAFSGDASHTSSDWQISDNNTFSDSDCSDANIVWCSMDNTTYKTSITPSASVGTFQNALNGKNRLNPNTAYYIRVRHTNAVGDSSWSSSVQITTTTSAAPSTPTNSTPSNGATSQNLTSLQLASSAYSESEGDSHAYSQWGLYTSSSDCSSAVTANSLITVADDSTNKTTYTIGSTLTGATTYYWSVRHKDEFASYSSWSSCTSFATQSAVPSTPTISAPSSGATSVSRNPAAASSAYSAPLTHTNSDWQISDNNTFSDSDCSDANIVWCSMADSSNKTSITPGASVGTFQNALSGKTKLAPDTQYYIRVRYRNAQQASSWATASSFTTTTNVVPATPTLSSPSNALDDISYTPALTASTYSESEGDAHSASQWVIYSSSSDCSSSTVASATYNSNSVAAGTSHTVASTLTQNTTYYWSARYQDNYSGWSNYASCFSFTTKGVPDAPTITAPSSAATNISRNPIITTSAFAGTASHTSTTYEVYDAASLAATAKVWSRSTTTESQLETITANISNGTFANSLNGETKFDPATRYWVRAKHTNSEGDSTFSNAVSFTTQANSGPNKPTNTTPADGATNVSLTPTLTSSDYSEGEGDTHAASQFVLYTSATDCSAATLDSALENSGALGAVTSYTIITTLTQNTAYYWSVRYQDEFGTTSSWSTCTSFNAQNTNDAPTAPTSGFSPADGVSTASQTPTLSWNAATDVDPDDTTVTLSYQLCLSTSATLTLSCTGAEEMLLTSTIGSTQVSVTTTLSDETTYYYAVRTRDDGDLTSDWSTVQNFYVNTDLEVDLTITKSVAVNLSEAESISLRRDRNMLQETILPAKIAQAAGEKMSYVPGGFFNTRFGKLLLEIFTGQALFFFILGLIVASVGNILSVVRKKIYKIPAVLFRPTHISFERVAQRKADGTFKDSYATHHRKVMSSKAAFFGSIILIVIKVGVVSLISNLLFQTSPTFAFQDDGAVVNPGDTLTYRIDWAVNRDGAATSFTFSDLFPEGTTYVSGSAQVKSINKTDANDSDEVTVTAEGITFALGTLGVEGVEDGSDSGYVLFALTVNNPGKVNTVENTATYTYSEAEEEIPNTNTTTNPVQFYSAGGAVYQDLNQNESQDKNEEGFPSVNLTLYQDSDENTALDTKKDTLLATVTTATSGIYSFTGLGPMSNYFVLVDESTLPDGTYALSTENGNPSSLSLISGQNRSDINFGYYNKKNTAADKSSTGEGVQLSIGNMVWLDTNRDKKRDKEETGLADVTMKLYEDNDHDGNLNTDEDTLVGMTQTNADGNYIFSKLASGKYFVAVDEGSQVIAKNAYTLTTRNNPKKVVLTTGDKSYEEADFGYARPTSSIGGYVYLQSDNTGLADVTLGLYRDENSNLAFDTDTDTFIGDTKTTQLGYYRFNQLKVGDYIVFLDTDSLNDVNVNYALTSPNPQYTTLTSDNYQQKVDLDFAANEQDENENKALLSGIDIQLKKLSLNDHVVVEETRGLVQVVRLSKSKGDIIHLEGTITGCPLCVFEVDIFSDPIHFTTTLDKDGAWAIDVPADKLAFGKHRLIARVVTEEGPQDLGEILVLDLVEKENTSWLVFAVILLLILVLILFIFFIWSYKRGQDRKV